MPSCAWTSPRCAGRSTPMWPPATCRASSSAPPARSAPAPSIRCRRSPRSAGSTACGSTSTAPTAGSRRPCPRRPTTCAGSSLADSVAVDPHKWLYAPLEAGCALVRDPDALRAAFSYHPPYYHFDERATNYRRLRPAELARLPRAQGVAGAAAGRRRRLPADDRGRHPAVAGDGRRGRAAIRSCSSSTQELSITTFRYVPRRSASDRRRAERSNATSTRSTARCSIGCSAAARRSSRTPSSTAATCCAPAS